MSFKVGAGKNSNNEKTPLSDVCDMSPGKSEIKTAGEGNQYYIYCRIYSSVLRTSNLAVQYTEGNKLSIKWV